MSKSLIVQMSGTVTDCPTSVVLEHLNEFIGFLAQRYQLEVLSINHTFETHDNERLTYDYDSTVVFLSSGCSVRDIVTSLRGMIEATDFSIEDVKEGVFSAFLLNIFMKLQHLS